MGRIDCSILVGAEESEWNSIKALLLVRELDMDKSLGLFLSIDGNLVPS